MIINDSENPNLSPKTKKEIIEDALKKPKLGVIINISNNDSDNTAIDH